MVKFLKRLAGCLLMVGCSLCVVCHAGDKAPSAIKAPPPAKQRMGPEGTFHLHPGDHCPVCGMFPARIPQCAAGLELRDGRTYYFCSNRCALQAWRQPSIYLGADAVIARFVVLDYFSGQPMDAGTAWWIVGSDVVGPMGPALVALQSREDVDAFQRRHGGTQIFRLDQIDDALWRIIIPPGD